MLNTESLKTEHYEVSPLAWSGVVPDFDGCSVQLLEVVVLDLFGQKAVLRKTVLDAVTSYNQGIADRARKKARMPSSETTKRSRKKAARDDTETLFDSSVQ